MKASVAEHAAADTARGTAVAYLERVWNGSLGEFGTWYIDELMPKGYDAYPTSDLIACAQKIRNHLTLHTQYGGGLGPWVRKLTREEADAQIDLIYGPRQTQR